MAGIDLVALVIELCAMMPTYIDNHMGRAVQYFGLMLIDQQDAPLAETLHDSGDQKPFTASGLMQPDSRGDFPLYGHVEAGDCAVIRLTGLSESTAAALLGYHDTTRNQLAQGEQVIIELDRLPWAVRGIHLTQHPWAGCTTYQTLIDQQRQAYPPKSLTLHFIAPTTFRSQTVNMPLPLPTLVFGSLLTRWTNFTSHRLRDLPKHQLDAFIAHHLLLSRHDVRTEMIRGKQGGKEIGFIGTATYELIRKSDHLTKHDPELEAFIQAEHVWFARTLGLLADFAFYSGVGRKTTTGMGMVL